jgi:hypothetical protein
MMGSRRYALRRSSLGRSTRKYLRTTASSRPCNGAPQLRHAISRSGACAGVSMRTSRYLVPHWGQKNDDNGCLAVIEDGTSFKADARSVAPTERWRINLSPRIKFAVERGNSTFASGTKSVRARPASPDQALIAALAEPCRSRPRDAGSRPFG